MSEGDTGYSYIATRPCGCICAACIDNPKWKKDAAKLVSDCIKAGFPVERVVHETLKNRVWACEVCRPTKPKKEAETDLGLFSEAPL